MQDRYTAWVSTVQDVLSPADVEAGANADVEVLKDKIGGHRVDDNEQEIPEWDSTGPALFHQAFVHDDETPIEDLMDAAAQALQNAGWAIVGDTWEPVPTGYVTEVTRA